jgi:hypothetical protein
MKDKPSEGALTTALECTWQNHFQTREQSWKTLQINALLVIGFVGADIKIDNLWVTICLGFMVIIVALSGLSIAIHHRIGQRGRYKQIMNLEKQLGLLNENIISDVKLPKKFKVWHIFNPLESNTPLFMMRIHVIIIIFSIVYLISIIS